jgi:hypothetical protein
MGLETLLIECGIVCAARAKYIYLFCSGPLRKLRQGGGGKNDSHSLRGKQHKCPKLLGVAGLGWACGIYVVATLTDFGKWGKGVGAKMIATS